MDGMILVCRVFSRKNHKRLRFAQHTSNDGKRAIATQSQKVKN
jgi:hypothetical protein